MLDPEQRRLYVDALKSPEGYRFDSAIAATYSLDLVALLSVPLHLLMFSNELSVDAIRDPVAVLEALRRTSERLTVYCQAGQIHAPTSDQLLYPLVESTIVEVTAPRGGAFHPKLWLLRFVGDEPEQPVHLRALILSRNLTFDRSWDVSLRLDGVVTSRKNKNNDPLASLVRTLPTLAPHETTSAAKDQAETFAAQVQKTQWELPADFDELRFATIGLADGGWKPPRASKIAVISPFCEIAALDSLSAAGTRINALVTRTDTLERLGAPVSELAERIRVLKDTAESEDGEDTADGHAGHAGHVGQTSQDSRAAQAHKNTEDNHSALRGLHAKTYICETNGRTCIAIGSANATNAALLAGSNVELMAELWGSTRRVGSIESILADDALGKILEPAVIPETSDAPDPARLEAETALANTRKALIAADLHITCEAHADAWQLILSANGPVPLAGIATIRAWPITLSESGHATDARQLEIDTTIPLGHAATASITGLIAFELRAEAVPLRERFVLNLPIHNAPADRFSAITRTLVNNREGFLRYLLFLLADLGDSRLSNLLLGRNGNSSNPFGGLGLAQAPILEQLVTALIHEPTRLHAIKRLIEDIGDSEDGTPIVPEEFAALWRTFEPLLEEPPA